MKTIYQQHGHDDRHAYFMYLADKYKVKIETVMQVADPLSSADDFGRLVSRLDNYREGMNCG